MNRLLTFVRTVVCTTIVILSVSVVCAQEIPVLVNTVSSAKAMMILDDSGSMESVMEHEDFDPESAAATSASNKIPSVIFRLESGNSAPNGNHDLRPILIEYNYLFNNVYTSSRGSVWGNLYESKSLNDVGSMDLVKHMGCTTSTSYCKAPGDGNYWGIHNAKLFDASTTGSSVFSTSNLAKSGGVNVTDSSGNEYLYMDYYSNVYYSLYFNWGTYWPMFDEDGDSQDVTTRVFTSSGGTVVFNGKEVFLSAGLYRLEYLRWIFYAATEAQRAELPGATRLEIVKEVMENLINNNPEVEFGITTLNGTNLNAGYFNNYLINQFYQAHGDATVGSNPKVRAPIGSDSATLISSLATIAASSGTPLANTYIETLRYFGGESANDPYCPYCNYSTPMDSECDSHFVVMLTDG
ncbi:MAG: hypothetical protein KDD62_05920, partial [Bdellovibrionales bacterium]|nr:hypothetical protein [Bdellovibrionales bacterium]